MGVAIVASCLIAALFAVSAVCSGPVAEREVSFALPFGSEPGLETDGPKAPKRPCLADSLQPGLKVVLVGETGACEAKTAGKFTNEYPEFTATRLVGNALCLRTQNEDEREEKFRIAVIGVHPKDIRVLPLSADKSPLPKDIEAKARRLPHFPGSDPCSSDPELIFNKAADSPPDIIRAGDVAFLGFRYVESFPGVGEEEGPPAVLINNEVFRLCGTCQSTPPFFFTIRDKLYLTYSATGSCCGCGDLHYFVYDLSTKPPKLVYQNARFSD